MLMKLLFDDKICFKNRKKYIGNSTDFYHKTNKEALTVLC